MATVPSPSRFAVRMIRHAISPRLAMRIFRNIRRSPALLRRSRAAPEAIFAYPRAHSPEQICSVGPQFADRSDARSNPKPAGLRLRISTDFIGAALPDEFSAPNYADVIGQ